MPAEPEAGQEYRQEYYEGEAEDNGEVLAPDQQAQVAAGHFTDVLLTADTIALEPRVLEYKLYAPDEGLVLTLDVSGGAGREELLASRDRRPTTIARAAGTAPARDALLSQPGIDYDCSDDRPRPAGDAAQRRGTHASSSTTRARPRSRRGGALAARRRADAVDDAVAGQVPGVRRVGVRRPADRRRRARLRRPLPGRHRRDDRPRTPAGHRGAGRAGARAASPRCCPPRTPRGSPTSWRAGSGCPPGSSRCRRPTPTGSCCGSRAT